MSTTASQYHHAWDTIPRLKCVTMLRMSLAFQQHHCFRLRRHSCPGSKCDKHRTWLCLIHVHYARSETMLRNCGYSRTLPNLKMCTCFLGKMLAEDCGPQRRGLCMPKGIHCLSPRRPFRCCISTVQFTHIR
jgi:hypothetical protein